MKPDAEQLVANAKFRVIAHLASITSSFLIMFIVAPILSWMVITVYSMSINTPVREAQINGRLDAFSERVTQLQETDARLGVKIDNQDIRVNSRFEKHEDRIRALELRDYRVR